MANIFDDFDLDIREVSAFDNNDLSANQRNTILCTPPCTVTTKTTIGITVISVVAIISDIVMD